MDLCRRTSGLAHPLPVSQVGSSNIQVRLHYIDGNYTVLPEVVEASLGPHMQVSPPLSFFFSFIFFFLVSVFSGIGIVNTFPFFNGYAEYATA